MKKRTIGWWGVCLVVSIAIMLLFASRTSPLYSLLLGDYSGNEVSSAMLIGKYWIQGKIPYVDLFAIGGPVYYLIQAIGWLLGGRSGIFVLQIINFVLFLIYLQKLLNLFVPANISNIMTVSSVIMYIAFCGGGNSSSEWCLAISTISCYLCVEGIVNNRFTKRMQILIGIFCGMVLGIHPIAGGILYGSIIFILCMTGEKKRIYPLLAGIVIPILIVVIYFISVGGLKEMLQGAFIYPMQMITAELLDIELLMHKAVKCLLLCPALIISIYKIYRGENKIGFYITLVTVINIVLLIYADNSWDDYIVIIPIVLLGIALLISDKNLKFHNILIINILLIIGISVIPIKNYVFYLNEGVAESAEEFFIDLQSFYYENEENSIVMLDTDNSYYLLADQKPVCRYIANQTQLSEYDKDAKEELNTYLAGTKNTDILITTEHGWVGQELENFSLVQVYVKKRGNICIYVANY